MEQQDLLGKLTQGLSNHIKTSTRYLLALLLVSVVTLTTSAKVIPANNKIKNNINMSFSGSLNYKNDNNPYYYTGEISNKAEKNSELKVPFIGSIPINKFHLVSATFICILMILYGISYNQSIRSRKLLAEIGKDIKLDIKTKDGTPFNINDVSEILISTSINTTAPLTQSMLGKHQFHHNSYHQYKTKWRIFKKKSLFIYDFFLKFMMMAVMYGLPILAVLQAYILGGLLPTTSVAIYPLIWILWILTLISFLVVAQLIISDFLFACVTTKRGLRIVKISAKRYYKKAAKNA